MGKNRGLHRLSAVLPANAKPGSTLSPFRHRIFLAVWLATVVSHFGGQIQGVGASWLMISLDNSPQLIALVATVTLLPVVLFSLPFGAIADTYDRRKVLLVAQLIMFLASCALALAAFLGMVTPAVLLSLTFLLGCGFALNSPAWQTAVGDFVPPEELAGAISLNILGFQMARTVAPALGGIIVAAAGPKAAFAINAVTYTALLVVLLRWKPAVETPNIPAESISSAVAAGLRYVAYADGAMRTIIRSSVFSLSLAALIALLPLIVKDLLGGGSLVFGTLLACGGAGAIVGASAATRLRANFDPETIVRVSQLIVAGAIATVAFSRSIPLTALAQFISGAATVVGYNSLTVTMQLSVPRWIVGRAMSIYQMGTFGGLALGAWGWGIIAEYSTLSTVLGISSASMLLTIAIGLTWPLLTPEPNLMEPQGRHIGRTVDVPEHYVDRPVTVTIEYTIDEHDAANFNELMRHRRRIMRKSGVLNWSLMQDIDQRTIWIENFTRASWTGYLRQRERRTRQEHENYQALLALQQDGSPPEIRYYADHSRPDTASDLFTRIATTDPRYG